MSAIKVRLNAVAKALEKDRAYASSVAVDALAEIERLQADNALLVEERDRLRKALKGCKTHIAGFHLRNFDQAAEVLSEFNSELQRIHRLACAALEAAR